MILRHFALATALAATNSLTAQDVVTLHSVTVLADNNVTVVYSKNFATCAHMRFNNGACTQMGVLTHTNNIFCTQGSFVSVTVPPSAFIAGFGPGIPVFMVHGNNSGTASACVTVSCNGTYGTGCVGTTGAPALDANDDCPPAGTTVDFTVSNGLPGSIAVLGFGIGQANIPVLGCNLLLGSVLGTVAVPFNGSGAGTFAFPLPIGSAGVVFTTQAFAIDAGGPQGFSATNGLLVRVL